MLDISDRNKLFAVARYTIERALYRQANKSGDPPLSDALCERRASFVTLKADGLLRGCIGTLEPVRRLYDDVAQNAHAAAFRDPRFPPLSWREVRTIRIEISVLDIPKLLDVANYRELLAALHPGRDGLVVEAGHRRATFLPAVWESLTEPEEFIAHLWQKAGLPRGSWPPGIRLLRYATEQFEEIGTDTVL